MTLRPRAARARSVSADAAQAAKLTVDQGTRHRKFGGWCLAATGFGFAALAAALPEARAALGTVSSG